MSETGIRYKAFISYSHNDEEWGRWLQKSLESYRIPRRLVGSPGKHGKVPARVAPVFRDREDLSSAADLTTSVRAELTASETLIVICSPAAAASPWVNEEIRFFKELGRGNRILALIVEGDPNSTESETRCFPPAMVEAGDGGIQEPLGADARKWADGKSLARLKLVAGILGIRLDDLRQRDMQRKHRLWMVAGSGAIAIALITSILAIVAITARDQAETRRQHAEDLVDYMVDDLKEKLDEVGQLDILEDVGGAVQQYLDTLNPQEESDGSLLQKAKVLRQLGEVAMEQGKLEDAMVAFEKSREVTHELHLREPQNIERIYELGQDEFWVGYVYLELGEFEAAQESFERYLQYSDRLTELDPSNPEWIMEQSYAQGNIAALVNRRESGDIALALERITSSVELNRKAIELDPGNHGYTSEYGEALAWQADTQLLLCDLGGALKSRQESLRIARETMEEEPANMNRKQRYAYANRGLAYISRQVGLSGQAMEQYKEATRVVADLYLAEPSNMHFLWDELLGRVYIAVMKAELGQFEEALIDLQEVYEPKRQVLQAGGDEDHRRRSGWIDYLLRFSDIAWMAGHDDHAEKAWSEVVRQMDDWIEAGADPKLWLGDISFARFLIWHYGSDIEITRSMADTLPEIKIDDSQPYLSCIERHLLVLQELRDENVSSARAHAKELLSKGYFEPGFVRICNHYDLCQGSG